MLFKNKHVVYFLCVSICFERPCVTYAYVRMCVCLLNESRKQGVNCGRVAPNMHMCMYGVYTVAGGSAARYVCMRMCLYIYVSGVRGMAICMICI